MLLSLLTITDSPGLLSLPQRLHMRLWVPLPKSNVSDILRVPLRHEGSVPLIDFPLKCTNPLLYFQQNQTAVDKQGLSRSNCLVIFLFSEAEAK